MSEAKKFKCVNCGEPTLALFKTYSPSVLKLTKCDICNGVVDKYIEYDPVIIMIDLVLMSNEAQRHVIYNTQFKSYWKLFIVLLMLETYSLWKNDSLFNIVVSSACKLNSNNTIAVDLSELPYDFHLTKQIALPEGVIKNCAGWDLADKTDDNDLFLWEKDFYINVTGSLAGTAVFLLFLFGTMSIAKLCMVVNKVTFLQIFQTFSLGNTSNLFTLPMLVWGTNETTVETRFVHYALVYVYTYVGFISLFTVLYECKKSHMAILLIFCNIGKFVVLFYTTPYIRKLAE